MGFFKKTCLTLTMLFLIISIFKDLTVGTIIQDTNNHEESEIKEVVEKESKPEEVKSNDNNQPDETVRFKVKSYTAMPGDTVLSIVESLNNEKDSIQMEQIITDFEQLNPGISPHEIETNTTYLFPIYNN
ncbi:hypothetical protein [Aquibacillus rhizosphaerae]|uniref:LysM domain-containing protein n=1 Tax=Aquibacillus rhizosphaerae TaxID=3051431 RepID=A0ABT7L6P8_9BACI|nr:hypothetical protein [Aquibacillus sp. LR5S19]MDL4841530.1 hypothetical protein [Aquibacillus sp. LR5S19]